MPIYKSIFIDTKHFIIEKVRLTIEWLALKTYAKCYGASQIEALPLNELSTRSGKELGGMIRKSCQSEYALGPSPSHFKAQF